jgi:hypothetical protein
MQITPPQIGLTYVSRTDPKLIIYVVDVIMSEADGDTDTSFIVEGCDPAYKDDTENADGYELTDSVWAKHGFTLVPG